MCAVAWNVGRCAMWNEVVCCRMERGTLCDVE